VTPLEQAARALREVLDHWWPEDAEWYVAPDSKRVIDRGRAALTALDSAPTTVVGHLDNGSEVRTGFGGDAAPTQRGGAGISLTNYVDGRGTCEECKETMDLVVGADGFRRLPSHFVECFASGTLDYAYVGDALGTKPAPTVEHAPPQPDAVEPGAEGRTKP
jgi:hypothetical protein